MKRMALFLTVVLALSSTVFGVNVNTTQDKDTMALGKLYFVNVEEDKQPVMTGLTLAGNRCGTGDFSNATFRSLTVGANVNGQGKIWWDEANTFKQNLYAVLGAHILADLDVCKVNVWGRNLTDSKYNTFAFLSKATGKPVYSAQRGNPLQVGMDVNIHF